MNTLRRIIYLSLSAVDRLFGRRLPVVILCYHSISTGGWLHSVTLDQFKSQIDYLSRHYKFISLSQFVKKRSFSSPVAAITFDDGYKDVLSVIPILKKYRVRPTVFVLSDPDRADRKELGNDQKLLSPTNLEFLVKTGWEIGCHSATHPDFYRLTSSQISSEITAARKKLESRFKIPVPYFAYPKGRYTPAVIQAVKSAGFSLALSVFEPPISIDSDPYRLGRISPNLTHSFDEFRALLTPTLNYLNRFRFP